MIVDLVLGWIKILLAFWASVVVQVGPPHDDLWVIGLTAATILGAILICGYFGQMIFYYH